MFYAGLDVSLKRTSVCVVDAVGKVVKECSVPSHPDAIAAVLSEFRDMLERVGQEASVTSAWLHRGLRDLDFPVIVIDAAHAAAALRTGFRNKTDRNDARGIADLMRVNKFRSVWVKSPWAQRRRSLIVARECLLKAVLDIENTIRSILQSEGMELVRTSHRHFAARVAEIVSDDAELATIVRPLLVAIQDLGEQVSGVEARIIAQVKEDRICRQLMTVPGVGPLTAFTYSAAIDEPTRFRRSRDVGAHFGLTPRQYQSGETDYAGRISRAGDAAVRLALYRAAHVMIHRTIRWCALKSWAMQIAKRRGLKRAKIALARKLAVVMHQMWIADTTYRWTRDAPSHA